MAIGILGGTFDPVHCGHLRLAIELRERLELERVRLLPAGAPRLRDPPVANAQHRLQMLVEAIRDVPGLDIDPRELDRSGPTCTVDTLQAIRDEQPDRSVCFIVGADAFSRLDAWSHWRRLPELAHLVVAERPGVALPGVGPLAELVSARATACVADLHHRPAGRVLRIATPPLDISASDIRRRLRRGSSIHYLVPPGVGTLIEKYGIYPACQS